MGDAVMSLHLTNNDKESIRKSVVASKRVLDPRVSAKQIAAECLAVPKSVSPALRAEAVDFAIKVVRDYRAELMMDLIPDV